MRWFGRIIGVIFVLVGILWTLQGLNIVHGSVMSGNSTFVIVGPIVAVVGLMLLLLAGARSRRV